MKLVFFFFQETLKYQIVHNVVFVQALFILLIAIDRYFSLFPNYDPFIESSWTPSLITILPYILVAVLLDFRLQNIIFGTSVALFIWWAFLSVKEWPQVEVFTPTLCGKTAHISNEMLYNTIDFEACQEFPMWESLEEGGGVKGKGGGKCIRYRSHILLCSIHQLPSEFLAFLTSTPSFIFFLYFYSTFIAWLCIAL